MTIESYVFEITLNVCCLLFIVFLGIIYLTKRFQKNLENQIYKYLVSLSIIDIIFELVYIFSTHYIDNEFYVGLAKKSFFAILLAILILLVYYVFIVLHEKNEKVMSFLLKNLKLHTILLYTLIIVIGTIEILLPSSYAYNSLGNVQYMYGTATWFTYITSAIIYLSIIPFILLNINTINRKKVTPYFIILVFELITLLVSIILPDICVACVSLTLACYLMYHTIENPDLRLVEELEIVKDEAIKANNAKSDFLSSMSHELRTPLNVILGFSQSLLEQDLPKSAKEDIQDIMSASDTLLELVNEILDISKIESNKLEMVETEYISSDIYKYLVTMTEGRIGSKNLEFIHNFDENIPPVLYGDCVRIKQVVVNFLTNAVKYTEEGYIKLDMSYEKIDDDYCYINVAVSDSGMGIKEEDLKKLFSKFERFDLQKNANIEGTGLGLALTKNLVDLLGGEINVESKYGVGSTFSVKFKQKIIHKDVKDVASEEVINENVHFKGHGEKILIVDDNNVNLKVAARMFGAFDLNLDLVNSGKECLSRITSGNKYDLVFLDDQMPEMSGVETMNHLKNIPEYNIPTIALTANAISGMREKYLADGFNDYLSKPINKVFLEELLIKYLGANSDDDKDNNSKEISKEAVTDDIETLEILDDEPTVENNLSNGARTVSNDSQNEKLNEQFLRDNGVDVDHGLELLGDMEMYNETVKDFVAEIDTKMADIQRFYDAKDMPNYAILVHSLKSDSKYIGLMHLAELAYNHEMASKANDVDFVTKNYDELIQEANKMIDIIKRYSV